MSAGPTRPPGARQGPRAAIRAARRDDLAAVVDIYNQAVEDGGSTCDLSGFTAHERRDWFRKHEHPFGIWVAERDAVVVGWVALSPFIDKPCFHRTALSATYVARGSRGQGLGRSLRQHVLARAREHGFHSIVARMWATNEASIHLTEQLGYRLAGVLTEAVSIDGKLLDVLFYQRMLAAEPAPAPSAGSELAAGRRRDSAVR